MLEIGQTISHYRIVEKIGQGGMGEVYLADDTTLDRKVALKFLPEAFTSDTERMARFEREAKLLASLNHPNIAGIYGLEQADGNRFLVLEYVEGETLQVRLSKGALPLEEALAICRQIAEGLEAAHEKGVIHRDLKPANVMIAAEEKVKILDFGLAKALSDESQSIDSSQSPTLTEAMTQPGLILGTAAYMSPEQAKGKSVDKRADIWAFGCILYECLTGKRAFEGETVTETLAAVIKEGPNLEGVPLKVGLLLGKCLAKDRKNRLRDIGDAMIWIDSYPVPVPESARVNKPWLAWCAAAVFLIVSVIIFFIHYHNKPIGSVEPVTIETSLPDDLTIIPYQPSFSLSPDGKNLAFITDCSDSNKCIQIYSLEPRLLKNTAAPDFCTLFWSPDSRFLAYCAGDIAKMVIKKVDILSGETTDIYSNHPSIPLGGAWNEDNTILIGTIDSGIMRFSNMGGTVSPLTYLNEDRQEIGHAFPAFLSDGKHFLYFTDSSIEENTGLYVGNLDSKPEEHDSRQIMQTRSLPFYIPPRDSGYGQLLYIDEQTLMAQAFNEKKLKTIGEPLPVAPQVKRYPNTKYLSGYFSSSTNGILVYLDTPHGSTLGSYELVWKDRKGNPIRLAAPAKAYEDFRLSRDEKKLVYGSREDIWVIDLDGETKSPLSDSPPGSRLTNHRTVVGNPLWSHDGLHILYSFYNSGHYTMFERTSTGNSPERPFIESKDSYICGTDCSDDGRFVLYQILRDKTGWDIGIAQRSNGEHSYYLEEEYGEQSGVFSPYGDYIAYVSYETGINEIYVQSFPKSNFKERISDGGGSEPRWNKNGHELFYMTPERSLMSITIEFKPDFKKGEAVPLMSIPKLQFSNYNSYEVSKDGLRFLTAKPIDDKKPYPIDVVVNWPGKLKK